MVNWCFLALNHRLSFKEWKTAVRGRSSNWILLANAEGHATHPRLVGKTSGRQLAMVYLPLSQLVYLPSQLVPVIQDDGPSNWCVLGDRVMYVGSLQIKCHQKLADFNPNKKPLPVFWRFDIYPIFHDICFSTKQPTPSPWNVFFFFPWWRWWTSPCAGRWRSRMLWWWIPRNFVKLPWLILRQPPWDVPWFCGFCWIFLVDWQGSFKWICFVLIPGYKNMGPFMERMVLQWLEKICFRWEAWKAFHSYLQGPLTCLFSP